MTAQWNRDFEAGLCTLPSEAWDRWLWRCDLHDPIEPLNECHLLGMLIARYRALYNTPSGVSLGTLWPHIVHGSIRMCELSVRQLRDTMEDLQHHWASYTEDWDKVQTALDGLTHNFGVLMLGPIRYPDDPASLTTDDPPCLTVPAMRRLSTVFCVLYRHLHLACVAEEVVSGPNPDIFNHHLQAAMDTYYEHVMLSDLPPASRITYKQDFSGMYHCVSQVVYFHYPSYERKRPPRLEDVRLGLPAVHALASAMQLHPELKVVYEDELFDISCRVAVLVAGGRIYVLEPGSAATRRVCTSAGLWGLLA